MLTHDLYIKLDGAYQSMRSIRVLGIITALLFAAMAIYTSPLQPSIPEIQLTFTDAAFHSILHRWNPYQVAIFKRHFLIDYPFLVCYGLLGYLVSRKTGLFANYAPLTRTLLTFTLPVAAFADAAENSFHLLFLYGTCHEYLYFAAGSVSTTKWMLIIGFIGCAAYARLRTVH